jgi:penicillin-binding protein 2
LAQHPNDNYLLNDYIGKTGVEAQFENYLRGIPGQDRSEIDAAGDFQKTLADIPPVPGNDVKLNIDYDLQKEIYDALTAEMQTIGKTRGAAVATNPQTGEVLALTSLPSFDNNMFARGISSDEYQALLNDDNPLLDRAIAGTYPPGSTVKPMLAVAALTEKVITPQTEILDDGVIRIGSFTYYGYEHSGLGVMNVYTAIAKSSDIFFYTVGGGNPKDPGITGLGPDKLAEWYRKFHLGSKLGIDLPGEKDGLVADPEWKQAVKNEQWYLGDTYHYSIGQGDLLATPLQINSWTSTIANGGKIMQPYVLNQVINPEGAVIAQGSPHALSENAFDPQWIKVAQDGMRQTVSDGTARSLNTLPFAVSGKTGTAQFDGSDLTRTHAWFTSYAPSDNPQIALTILIEDGGEGSSVSVPVAREVYQWWAQNRYQP